MKQPRLAQAARQPESRGVTVQGALPAVKLRAACLRSQLKVLQKLSVQGHLAGQRGRLQGEIQGCGERAHSLLPGSSTCTRACQWQGTAWRYSKQPQPSPSGALTVLPAKSSRPVAQSKWVKCHNRKALENLPVRVSPCLQCVPPTKALRGRVKGMCSF